MSKAKSYACKRLSEQIKFFGAKPKRFVSIYAKKPRIRFKVKDNPISTRTASQQARQAQFAAMRESNAGIGRSAGGSLINGMGAFLPQSIFW